MRCSRANGCHGAGRETRKHEHFLGLNDVVSLLVSAGQTESLLAERTEQHGIGPTSSGSFPLRPLVRGAYHWLHWS